MEPLLSVKFKEYDDIGGCILYVRPLYIRDNFNKHIEKLYCRYCRFGDIVGINLHKSFAYIVFSTPVQAYMASKIYTNFMYDDRLCISRVSVRRGLDFGELSDPPINSQLVDKIKQILLNSDEKNYISSWKSIINSFNSVNFNYERSICSICQDNEVDAKIECFCKEPVCCLECIINIVVQCGSICPVCRSLFDIFDVRLIKKSR